MCDLTLPVIARAGPYSSPLNGTNTLKGVEKPTHHLLYLYRQTKVDAQSSHRPAHCASSALLAPAFPLYTSVS